MRAAMGLMLLLLLCAVGLQVAYGATDPQDAAILQSLMTQWQNTPPNWGTTNDPCGTPWVGVDCGGGSRVTSLKLLSMGIKGTLSGDIGQLTELQSLDLSYNPELGGSLTSNIGNLKKLTTLILAGCSFSGSIPDELGNLSKLSFLALNSNKFIGGIPASLGTLSNMFWLDLAENQLTGTIPVSNGSSPGLDQLVNTLHFHFNKNKLSGSIPTKLFHSEMTVIHVLFDGNSLTGPIPDTIGLVQSLEALRLDRNSLTGPVPSSINNLTKLNELSLANNKLTGPMPDLTGMKNLNYLDLSNNSFSPSPIPAWFSTIVSLTALIIENGPIQGELPPRLFSFPQLQTVDLKNNSINDTLDFGSNISPQLQNVNLQNNKIQAYKLGSSYKYTLILFGNPVCNTQIANSVTCQLQQQQSTAPYSTSLANCGSQTCPSQQGLNPQSCACQYPYSGIMVFRAPFFHDLTNSTVFRGLEMSLWTKLGLTPGSVFLHQPFFTSENYIEVQVDLFPSTGVYFDRSEILRIGFSLSNQSYKPPDIFGPYYFIASPYPFPGGGGGSSIGTGAIIGIAIACIVLVIVLIAVGVYALRQKRKAEKAAKLSKPFASWGAGAKDHGGAPQLKGARWFSYEELKKSTNNFSGDNEIGSGGYGKVYRGLLASGQLVAIKRAQQGSTQGGLEFKTEIELLSRVHHKNLVGLVGFCFDQGEQMLVYEFIPNGTLRESLSRRNGLQLDWKRRLRIALGSARGLAYLHELANPPIIHRDVKSSNILLDENLTATVADFGLSKLVADVEKGHVSTQVKGTLGYLDPEYYMTQQLTEKSDVYSFGVVMLELVTAKQPIEKGKYIVREVRQAINKNDDEYYGLYEIMDPVLRKMGFLVGFRKFVELALQCVEESAANRPTMNEVVKEIEIILQSNGANINSASSSATEFGNSNGVSRHPYNELVGKEEINSNAFDYSGKYSQSAKIEPK